ncbi:hypothetical protein [Streptomyces collinus]|uniref:hypothetical protein n=1 Tax=Streptomyces collinus TaxID=42684 RepID=UPI003824E7BD
MTSSSGRPRRLISPVIVTGLVVLRQVSSSATRPLRVSTLSRLRWAMQYGVRS